VHLSAVVWAEKTLLSDSNNNELLVINLATVPAERILFPVLHKCVTVEPTSPMQAMSWGSFLTCSFILIIKLLSHGKKNH
jgi:hypothetical protein